MLTPDERLQQVVEWNLTAETYPCDRCVHHLIEEQAIRTPDAVAVEMGQSRLTYRELIERADGLASELRARGVMSESLVGLCLERSPDMVVCLLGIFKAGAAYVPLDPEAPPARLAMILDDAACALLITSRRLAGHCEGFDGPRFWWDDWEASPAIAGDPDCTSPHHAAYVIYTSGSTGTPKGVVVEHRAVVNLLWSLRRWPGIREDDVLLAAATVAFDISVLEMFLPLLVGARIVMTPDSVRADGAAMAELIKQSGATIHQATPTGWQMLIQAGWKGDGRIKAITGGEPLPAALAAALLERCGEVWNMYGPTETTVYSVGNRIRHHETITIGKPIANTRVYVVDGSGQLLPVGVPGELWIGGDGLARSYLRRPELTAEKFIADPFVDDPLAKVYRTGDRCRWLPEGAIEYLGRADLQVKIRGHRVELGDVEMAFGRLSDVQQAAVLSRADAGGMVELVAWLTASGGISLSLTKLRESLSEHLPEYMIPSRFYVLESMPLTPSGKVDRKALEGMDSVELDCGTDYMAPQGDLQCLLAGTWQSAMGRERVGIHDNFFALGGHSLVAVTICAQLAERLNQQIPLRWLLEHPTIDRLAAAIESASNLGDHCAISLADRSKPLPMSFAQQGMWVLQQTLPDAASYNEPLAWHLTGRVLRRRIQDALQRMVERHEVLRTSLIEVDGMLLQRIAAAAEIPLPWKEVDLQSLLPGQKAAVLSEQLKEDARLPFDLAVAPLWRVVWIQLAEDEQVLGFTFHHSIVDEWSMRLFGQELEQLYAADGLWEKAGLQELPVQYADFAVWQRERLTEDLLERQRCYWKDQLQDAPAALVLPADKPRPVQPSGQGGIHDFQIDGTLVTGLRELARTERTTLFTVMLTAYQVWLHRYTGAIDLVVGTPFARREQPEIQRLVGFFLNTLPIRMRLEGQPGFREVLRQTRKTLLEAFSHADLPFEQIVAVAGRDRNVGSQPLYQTLFVLLEDDIPAIHLEQVQARSLTVETRTCKNDLLLSVQATGAIWSLRLEYSADLFSADCVSRMAGHLTELLRSITMDADCPVGRLNLMPPAELHQVLVEWNATERDYPRGRCIHQLFEEQVERSPEAVAVVFGEERLTYRELNARANQLARHLISLGVVPYMGVGLCVKRSLEMVVSVLGILKAGGAYVPLDPDYPRDRLAFMLRDSGCLYWVTRGELMDCLPEGVASAICLEDLPSGLDDTTPSNTACPENLAYILYTSGSTGRPKGVAMEHASLVNLMSWELGQSLRGFRTLQFASLNFDVSFQEVFSTLFSGATLVLIDPHTRLDPAALWNFISKQNLERLFLPVVMLQQLVEAAGSSPLLAPLLREIITAGEQLRITPAIRRFFSERTSVTLHNHYGPTETHVVTAWTLPSSTACWPDLPPIGKPIANTAIYVLDNYLNPVPIGVGGELYIAGVSLARGYWKQPERTAERFVNNPFSKGDGSRLYKTGDMARYRGDGTIEYLGRTDHQIKIRGFRVELEEIEACLGSHPSVMACGVITRSEEARGATLIAFLVTRTEAGKLGEEMRSWTASRLPEYMSPSRFYMLESMPLTPSGKVDRKALEGMEAVELDCGTDYEAPRGALQCLLAGIWQSTMGRERVGIHDNFFALGGHSLVAVTICAQLAERLNQQIPLRWLLEHPTIDRLTAAIESASNSDDHCAISLADRSKPLPMSFAQQGMWVLQQTLPDAATYNQPLAWHFTGKVLKDKIQDALQRMVERHEVLRTSLSEVDGILLQRIASSAEIPLPWKEVDLQPLLPGQQAAVLAEHLEEDARRPFDLALAPLWRVIWIQLAEDEQVLGFTFHHSIVDEWSMRLFGQELELLYAADGSVEKAGLQELPLQYADFTVWQRERLNGEFLDKQRRYWKEQLQEPPAALVLPIDKPRPIEPSGQGGVHDFQIDGTLVAGLRELARKERTTLFTVMLAAYQVWLHRYTGATDFVVGTPVARREQPEIQKLLGFFLNTLPIRTRIEGQPCFREVLRQTRKTLLEAFNHADLPFEQIVAMAGNDRNIGSQPLYQTLFVLLEDDIPAIQLDRVEARSLPVETRTCKNDLLLSIQAIGATWSLHLEYSADLFSAERAARMAGHLTELLRAISVDADCPVGRLDLMSPAERHQVLVEWNATERDFPRDRCIHQLFEEQVERTPEAVAVVFGEEGLTYRDLNARANQVARHLIHRGVRPSDVVGIQIERSLSMMVGLLGILKAGGAYWAVEENLPEERFLIMLEDAKPRFLLVRKNAFEDVSDRCAGISHGDLRGQLVTLAIEDLELPLEGIEGLVSQTNPGERAYVSYTSGSTGKPKGVVVPHRAVVRLVKNTDFATLDSGETLLHMSPLSFDASTFEIWGGLLNGGRVVIMPPGPPSLAEIATAIKEQRITTLWLTAGLFHLMVDERLDDLKSLRQLLAGGDVLSPDAVRKARHALTGCRIINGYGPTENTTFTCCHEIVDDAPITGTVPIGRPIANTRVYILDSLLQPVPIGVAGELYAGGDGLACGYLNQPRLTSERFVADPFSPDPGAILYRTGDQCRWLENGTIEFLGRLDHQVKIRGFRVEPGEIEAVLRKHSLIRDCVVLINGMAPGEPRLVGYLTPVGSARCSDDVLREFATQFLPSYMMAHAFVWLDQLPLLSNGKLDRQRLPEPQPVYRVATTESGKAKNLIELELIRIWERLFQRSDIGRNDSFFDLGGHSLQAVRLIGEIEKLIGRRLPIASLFQSPTIALFSQRLVDSDWVPAWGSIVPLQPHGTRPPMFFIHGLGGDVFVFLELAKLLGEDQPSYGIQAVGVAGESAPHDSVVRMAADYCREITSFQPIGPYRLAGYSLGGIIAYETARQLRSAGHEVDLLALFDTEPLTVPRWAFYGLFVPERCLHHFARWVKAPFDDKVSYISKRWKALRFRFAWNLSKQAAADVSIRSNNVESSPTTDFLVNPVKVTLAYPIQRYPGRLDLFRADDANSRWSWFWRYMAIGGVTFHRIQGNHGQILDKDHVSSLASALEFRLGLREPEERPDQAASRPNCDADHLP